jgi:hypothetical protein
MEVNACAFRNLNDCTEDASWPIPNITEMLRRIGTHKATVFAVLDFTQGYHQALLFCIHTFLRSLSVHSFAFWA